MYSGRASECVAAVSRFHPRLLRVLSRRPLRTATYPRSSLYICRGRATARSFATSGETNFRQFIHLKQGMENVVIFGGMGCQMAVEKQVQTKKGRFSHSIDGDGVFVSVRVAGGRHWLPRASLCVQTPIRSSVG